MHWPIGTRDEVRRVDHLPTHKTRPNRLVTRIVRHGHACYRSMRPRGKFLTNDPVRPHHAGVHGGNTANKSGPPRCTTTPRALGPPTFTDKVNDLEN
jgi:hypothetical protein